MKRYTAANPTDTSTISIGQGIMYPMIFQVPTERQQLEQRRDSGYEY
jgi:hypothetical protein